MDDTEGVALSAEIAADTPLGKEIGAARKEGKAVTTGQKVNAVEAFKVGTVGPSTVCPSQLLFACLKYCLPFQLTLALN